MAITERPKPKYFTLPGPNLSYPWRIIWTGFPHDEIPAEEKQAIFAGDVKRIGKYFSKYSLTIPPNLLDRLLIVGPLSYTRLQVWHRGKVEEDTVGFCTEESNIAVVYKTYAESAVNDYALKYEDILRVCGIHELLHALSYTERWMTTDPNDEDYEPIRRKGFFTTRPVEDDIKNPDRASRMIGAQQLGEGLMNYLTAEITGLDDEIYQPYLEEGDIIKFLINRIKVKPLFLAMYTRHGLRLLNDEMDKVFGEGSLSLMLTHVGQTYENYKMREREGEEVELDYGDVLEELESLRMQKARRKVGLS